MRTAISQVAGCPPANDDAAPPDGDTPDASDEVSDPRQLTVNWHFKGLTGSAIPCPAGFTVMEIWITNTYDGYWQHIEQVPCSSSDGT